MKFAVTGIVQGVEVNDIIFASSAAEAKAQFIRNWGAGRKIKVK